ncbi:MAG: secretin N-terminal domain-containing protein [Candidatus Anstonellales archaeon]
MLSRFLRGIIATLLLSLPLFSQQDDFETDLGGPILEDLKRQDATDQIQTQLQNVPGTPIKPDATIETPLYEEAEDKSPLDRKIGPIRLKGAPLTSFLDIISAQSKVNFIVSDDVAGKQITVFLRRTTVREALEILLRVKGLTYQRIGKSNIYIIMKRTSTQPNLVTKIYTLNYIPLIPLTEKGGGAGGMSNLNMSDFGGGNVQQISQLPGQLPSSSSREGTDEDSGISIIRIIKSVLSKKYGTIAVDPRTNSVIVTDIPEVFPQVEQIIAELDKKAPQILIEARIVEINTDRLNELGIEWGGSRGELAYFAGPARLTDWGLRPGFFTGDSWKFLFPKAPEITDTETNTGGSMTSGGGGGSVDPIYSTSKTSPQGVYYGIFSLAQLQAIFRALVSRGEARYLGTPKIVAMNNKTSLITISRNAAVATETTVVSAGGSAGSSSTGVERTNIGLTLKVTPQVNKEGYITMLVQPQYSDITSSAITIQGQNVLDPITRGALTMVRVKNGQTVVIGGMLSSTEQKVVKKVPLFGYIPVIGWFFTSTSVRRTNTDLVIFLTPTILVD